MTYSISMETRQSINDFFLRSLGMTYDEFCLLEIDEQEKIIDEYHENHYNKGNKTIVGLTRQEMQKRENDKMYKMDVESSSKAVIFVKRMIRKSKNNTR